MNRHPRAVGCCAIAACVALLTSCGTDNPRAFYQRCLSVGGDAEAVLPITSPGGMLLVTLEERGVTVSASLGSAAESTTPAAGSPVDRLGTVALLAATAAGETATVRVRSEDSRDIKGQVCAEALILPTGSQRVRAERAFAQAGVAIQARDWSAAFSGYLAASREFDRLGLLPRSAWTRHALAELEYRRLDRKRDAFASAGQALANYPPHTDPAVLGAVAALQAKSLFDMPHDRNGLRDIEPAIRRRLAAARVGLSSSPLGLREVLRLDLVTGALEFELNAPAKAQPLFAASARRCGELGDWECYSTGIQNLAFLSEESNNFSVALSVYAQALRNLDSARYPRLVADIQDNLGRVQGRVGLFSESQRTHEAAMRQYAQLGDCAGVRRSLVKIGHLMEQIGELSDAEATLQSVVSLECPALLANAAALRSESTRPSDFSAGVPTSRAALCRQAIDSASLGTDNRSAVFDSLFLLHEALKLEGEPADAARCLSAARPYAADARAQMDLVAAGGTAFLADRKAGEARAAFEKTLAIADQANVPAGSERRGFARLGLVRSDLLAGNSAAALQVAYETLHSSVARADLDQTVTSLRLIASANTQRPDEAARTLEVAEDMADAVPIDELDGEKRATFLATQHDVFAQLTELYALQASSDQAAAWRAFETSERGRARSLRFAESQQTRDAAPSSALSDGRYGQFAQEIVQLANLPAMAPDALVRGLGEAARRRIPPTQALDRAALLQTLRRLDATVVEYAVGSHDMFAFVITADRINVVRLADRGEIADAAATLREVLRDSESAASVVQQASQRLARLVMRPLRDQLSTHRIIFVPDDGLHTVPFSVLPWSESASDLVVQHFETSIAPSALFVTQVRTTAAVRGAPRIALIGDPVFRVSDWRRQCIEGLRPPEEAPTHSDRALSDWTQSLPRLPGTRAEVAMVAALARQAWPASHVETLLGCAAVPSGLRAAANAGPDLLHIATHARVDAQRPRLSALALTPETNVTPVTSSFGLLDILSLRLNSRLVVLSACDTSRGKLLPGEGVLGPAQAFLEAGAAAVLASYWRIDDAATAEFMQRFYRYLLIDHQPAGLALRHAQLDAARTSTPHVWAAFSLYGLSDTSL